MGLLGSAYFYPYALMQIPAGLLSDSWGARKSVSTFLIVAFIGSVILGISQTPFLAIIGRLLVGFGVSMLFVPTMKVLSEWYNEKEFATMSGLLIAIGGVGSLSSAAPLAFLSSWIGWRMSFISVGIFTAVIAILVWLVVRDRPEDLNWASPAAPERDNKVSPIKLWEGVRYVLLTPWFWPVAIWIFFDAAIFFTLGGLWGGPYLMQVYHLSKAESGNILSMLSIGMIIGSPSLSYCSNRIVRGRKPILIMTSIMVTLITLIMALYTDKMSIPVLYLVFFGIGIFSSSVVAIGFTVTKELFPIRIAGTSIGLINLFPFLGGALFQPLTGYILEQKGHIGEAYTRDGYQNVMWVFFICSIITLVSSLFIKETVKKHSRPS